MFNNIGSKIMCLAKFLCWVGIVLSVSIGLANIITGITLYGSAITLRGVLLILLGPISSYIAVLPLYGFGRLVENSDIIVHRKD